MKYLRIIILIALTTSLLGCGLMKPRVYYNEYNEKITRLKFLKEKDYAKNLDVYIKNDTAYTGLLITRQKFGQLDEETFIHLKLYLAKITQKQINTNENIVINYLTAYPKKRKNTRPRSLWNVLHRDYLVKLHQIANINQFWINSPESDNLKYYHNDVINWVSDEENLLKKLFFKYDVRYGNFIFIKPDGKFYYYLGEHGKYEILEKSKKYFK